jgi:hypothetical protein
MTNAKGCVFALFAVVGFLDSASASPPPATIDAWQRYAAGLEQQLDRGRGATRSASHDTVTATGRSISVPSGTISHWHGSVFIRGVSLDGVLAGLTNPGTPPPQADVVASRVPRATLARFASTSACPSRHRHGHTTPSTR